MDGYPRSISQLNCFDPKFNKVFYLELPLEVCIERLMARGRADDTPETIKERLINFEKDTEPVVSYYEKQRIVKKIDASGKEEDVAKKIMEGLDGRSQE